MMPLRSQLLAALMLAPILSPALAAGVPPAERSAPIPPVDSGPPIAVVPASDLAGRPVLDRRGERAGRLAHILVDPATGRIRYAMIGDVPSGSFASGDAVPVVPWARLGPIPQAHAFRLDLDRSALLEAPRIHGFASAIRPEVAAQILDFAAASGGSEPPPTLQRDLPPPPDALRLPSNPATPETVGPPVLVSANAHAGVSVATQDGRPLGEIAEVLLDTASRQVAYVLVAEGGLRAPKAWLPVPVQILVPSPRGYSLAVETFWLRQVPPLQRPEPPSRIGSAWLAALYRNYGIEPYWRPG